MAAALLNRSGGGGGGGGGKDGGGGRGREMSREERLELLQAGVDSRDDWWGRGLGRILAFCWARRPREAGQSEAWGAACGRGFGRGAPAASRQRGGTRPNGGLSAGRATRTTTNPSLAALP
jgi:hypothetical protein